MICVVDTVEEARTIVQGTGNIILCQTKARREEFRVERNSVKPNFYKKVIT